jgi:hypothetical protein
MTYGKSITICGTFNNNKIKNNKIKNNKIKNNKLKCHLLTFDKTAKFKIFAEIIIVLRIIDDYCESSL